MVTVNVLEFQFLLVQLKGPCKSKYGNVIRISIPIGSIKRNPLFTQNGEFSYFNSYWFN